MQKFNGSLVRQFPSTVTGNAATGVQVTVFVSGTSTLASLFEDNETTPKSNPVTTLTNGFYSFKAADGQYRLEFAGDQFNDLEIQLVDAVDIRDDFDALEASNAAFLVEQQAAYDDFVLSQGWDQAGTFAVGFTYTSPNQVGQDVDGNWWRWNGSLPKTVTAGTLPSSDANYKLVGDGVLRSDLADALSEVLVGNVEAKDIAAIVTAITARTQAGLVYGDGAGNRYRVIAAVIRNTGAGWFIINDAAHEPTGLQSVSVEPDGTIRLNHNVGATQVGTLVATPDETFGKMGLTIGGSIGTSISFLQISAPLAFTVNTASGTLTLPAVLTGDVTASTGTGSCTINHPTVTTNEPPMAVSVGSAAKTDFNVSFGATQIVLDGVGDVDGYIRWNGSAWQYTGSLRTAPTFAFSGGELTVTHASADQYNVAITAREDGLVATAGAIDKTSFKVRFYDYTGAQVTTESALMKFYVTRRARALKDVIEGSVSIRSGYVPVDANNVVSATGNIWLLGLMPV